MSIRVGLMIQRLTLIVLMTSHLPGVELTSIELSDSEADWARKDDSIVLGTF